MRRFLVMREKDNVEVAIMRNKSDDTYSFVNLTKGHICKCRFETEDEAIEDMEKRKNDGKIKSYRENMEMTDRDIEVLNALKELGFKYIARDKCGDLYAHKGILVKYIYSWVGESLTPISFVELDKDLFKFVQWSDKEPYSIDELLAM